jgi:hypothetical protein
MGTKQDTTKSEVIKVRVTAELREKYKLARTSGSWSTRSDSDFLGYLIGLGLVRYEKSILPIERGDDLEESQEKRTPEGKSRVG